MGAEEEALAKADQRIASILDEIRKAGDSAKERELGLVYEQFLRERDHVLMRIQQVRARQQQQQAYQNQAQQIQDGINESWQRAFQQNAYEQMGAYNQQTNAPMKQPWVPPTGAQIAQTVRAIDKPAKKPVRVMIPCFVEIEVNSDAIGPRHVRATLRFHSRWSDRLVKMLSVLFHHTSVLFDRGFDARLRLSPDDMVALDGLMIGNLTEEQVEQPKEPIDLEPEKNEPEYVYGTINTEITHPFAGMSWNGPIKHRAIKKTITYTP